jgi:hypothetical protein
MSCRLVYPFYAYGSSACEGHERKEGREGAIGYDYKQKVGGKIHRNMAYR